LAQASGSSHEDSDALLDMVQILIDCEVSAPGALHLLTW